MPALVEERVTKARGFDIIVGYNIRDLRTRRGITQLALAKQVGMSQSTLSRAESGDRSLTFQQGIEIARILRVRPEVLARPIRSVSRAS